MWNDKHNCKVKTDTAKYTNWRHEIKDNAKKFIEEGPIIFEMEHDTPINEDTRPRTLDLHHTQLRRENVAKWFGKRPNLCYLQPLDLSSLLYTLLLATAHSLLRYMLSTDLNLLRLAEFIAVSS